MENKQPMMYQQRTLDFETPVRAEVQHVAETTSQPPPANQARQALPLVRPERQLTYGGIPHHEWPEAKFLHDRDTITVDRIRDDIDGPSHRFIIKRLDHVEAYFSKDHTQLGQVVGISHAKEEVCVKFPGGKNGIWFYKGEIYPAVETNPQRPTKGRPLSESITAANLKHEAGLTEADRVPAPAPPLLPFTFDDFKTFYREFHAGSVPFEDYHKLFEQLHASQDSLQGELLSRFKAKELAVLASRFGSWSAKRSTKEENAAHVVSKMLSSFVLEGSVSYSPLSGETYQEAVAKKVRAVSAGEYAREFEKRQAATQQHEKALENPETLLEFHTFLREKGEEELTDEQLALYDRLRADMTRKVRAEAAPNCVSKFQSEELHAIEFQLKEGFHDKRQCPLWIVQLSTRVERDAFNELNRKAKMLGGWFSSFKKTDAGFQFLELEKAERFCSLLKEDADRTDVLESRKERQELTAAERLHELAQELFSRAAASLEQSKEALQNTPRRSDIQAGVRGRCYADQAMSRTLHSIAEALSRGEAKYLDGIRHKTHVETLDAVLYLAKWARVRAEQRTEGETTFLQGRRLDPLEEEPIGPATIRFAEYPFPWIYKRHLEDLVRDCRQQTGVKQAAEKMRKRLAREKEEYVTFQSEHDIGALSDFVGRAKAVGVDTERVASSLEKYQRLNCAGITDIHQLRAALREYLGHRGEARGDSPVQIAERELIGKKLPGFFPTPRPVIERMLELAKVEAQHKVLEPSCGKGDILDALQAECPGVELVAIEYNRSLSDVLSTKGYAVELGDFLQHQGTYDRIVMNPPFENGSDMTHIQHAYSLLTPGGRLVSVISEGPFFRSDKQSTAFREWLAEVGGETETLPEDAFQGREAFRETGVRTRILTIERE
ncbi:methyltransferase [Bythopirellula goksoeyrii]|uniref:Methyltransferase small domain protein n=1 Tax=Bythopirellula goksoeyrii TaxID=1400387 RepID=A0A5B9QEF7_9BACT|nr:class I SAM-dependent methyltransferase [Bythopirellula goksoeyrii]QEG35975.1 Methyltransferase small domain protein [Bythopirellula goksoeyrii]